MIIEKLMIKIAEKYHVSVLLKESVDGLDIQPDGIYVDATFGGGGHSKEVLRRLGPKGRLFGFDQDADAEQNIVNDDRFTFVRSNFRYLKNWMRYFLEPRNGHGGPRNGHGEDTDGHGWTRMS